MVAFSASRVIRQHGHSGAALSANEKPNIGKPVGRQPRIRQITERNSLCSFGLGGRRTSIWRSDLRSGTTPQSFTPELHLRASPYTMPPTASIPRFLLPQGSAIWRTRLAMPSSTSLTIRNASNKKKHSNKSKPLVLEKPSKFTPPSHPARLRREGPRYPGPQLSDEEITRQNTKKYPNMMPPEGSFMHWFMSNKTIHMWITLVISSPPYFKSIADANWVPRAHFSR